MRIKVIILACVMLVGIFSCTSEKKSKETTKDKFSKAFYFNQQPPGLTPKIFAPELISLPQRNESFAAFSPQGDRFYFQAADTIFYMDFENTTWSKPQIATFLGDAGMGKYIRISADGNTFIFNTDGDIYANKKQGNEWSEPIKYSDNINSDTYECVANITADQSIYYASHREGTLGQCDIFYSEFVDGKYQAPVAIEAFNTFRSECNILLSPDNDFIIFTCFNNEDSFGSTDMYISFPLGGNDWSEPKNMGEVFNTEHADSPFSFTPDGKYFLFSRNNVIDSTNNLDIFWVETAIFENYKN